MVVTFPQMGTLEVVLRSLLTGFGLRVLAPPVTKMTLEIGAAHSPETACLPFKISLGSFIQALNQGADTILTCGGCGPCRLGYYAEIQRNILHDLGYVFDMVVVEPEIGNVLQAVRLLNRDKSWLEIYRSFRLAGAKMSALDTVERKVFYLRPRERQPGSADRLGKEAMEALDRAGNDAELTEAMKHFDEKVASLEIDNSFQPLRVGVVGEIYVMVESVINQDLFKRLGGMGVEVHPPMLLDEYVRTHILRNRQALRLNSAVTSLAAPFIGRSVGGHGVKSVGYTIKMGQAGFDGMVHVFPFTCMPEVIAKNILPQVSNTAEIPVLSMAFDEQTGVAGTVTRLEAFTDLLWYRRSREKGC